MHQDKFLKISPIQHGLDHSPTHHPLRALQTAPSSHPPVTIQLSSPPFFFIFHCGRGFSGELQYCNCAELSARPLPQHPRPRSRGPTTLLPNHYSPLWAAPTHCYQRQTLWPAPTPPHARVAVISYTHPSATRTHLPTTVTLHTGLTAYRRLLL